MELEEKKGTVLFEKRGVVGIMTINRPEALNALNTAVLEELDKRLDAIAADAELRVVVVTGAGRSFVAGADIAEMRAKSAEEGKAFGRFGSAVFRKLELSEKVFVAAVNGYALGGGCELAMACDIRLASEKAKFAQPETGLGIIPGFSGTQRLPRIVGIGMAKEMIYTGRVVDGTEAQRIGLVNAVYAPEVLMDEALRLANQIVGRSPLAVQYAKEAINRGVETDIDTGIAVENALFGVCFSTADQKARMEAFLKKK